MNLDVLDTDVYPRYILNFVRVSKEFSGVSSNTVPAISRDSLTCLLAHLPFEEGL